MTITEAVDRACALAEVLVWSETWRGDEFEIEVLMVPAGGRPVYRPARITQRSTKEFLADPAYGIEGCRRWMVESLENQGP